MWLVVIPQERMVALKHEHLDTKGEIAYAAASADIDAKSMPSKASAELVKGIAVTDGGDGGGGGGNKAAARKMGPREAWERIKILTEEESVGGVLAYWEDKVSLSDAEITRGQRPRSACCLPRGTRRRV